ncbi:hypothetical protein EVAR_30768_1 [Eumeta japonica]|uniref:DUF6570 domain-containing protein n=1 Tax=Eumeta variegata TaxID=151549 RepID=A0A4C1V908_EUMVA|nr:hypothetical protein EVAR_30768_1 [Eumeta japonica]
MNLWGDGPFLSHTRGKNMNKKKETTTQTKRRLYKAKLKRQEKIANESDVQKRQRLEKIKSADNCGIVIATEHLDNSNITREFSVSRDNVFEALTWLVANNSLYKDALIDNNANLLTDDLILVSGNACSTSQTIIQNAVQNNQDSVQINNVFRILQALWHQGNLEVITSGYAGAQCCAMAMSNIIRVSITPPQQWSKNTLDQNMIEGDSLYVKLRLLYAVNPAGIQIVEDGHLEIKHFDLVKAGLEIFGRTFALEYESDSSLFGS